MGKLGENGGFMGNEWEYLLVMTNIAMERSTIMDFNPLFLWCFSIAMSNYQRVTSGLLENPRTEWGF